MKINKFIIPICGLALTMLTTTSCSWFDVNPKTDVEAEDLFSTPDGFESALAGIYIASTERQAYGDNWTFGFMDKLVQSYDNIPQTENASTIYDYTRSGGSKDTQASMWQRSYFLIANANNLLRWLDKNGETVIVNEEQKRMLRGEALAWRAFLHFDLLRAWGPIYKNNPKAKSIPYRKVADNSKLPLLPADSVGKLILADIDSAQVLMEYERNKSLSGSSRRFRLNYWAITALKALIVKQTGLLGSMWALFLPGVVAVGNVIIVRNFFENNIPRELLEAAEIDGASKWTVFVKMVIPLSRSIMAVMVVYSMVAYWNDWFTALIYLRADQAPLPLVLRNILIKSSTSASQSSMVAGGFAELNKLTEMIKFASIIVAAAPMLIVYPFVQKYFEKGFMAGAVKG